MHDEFAKIEWLKARFELDGDSKKVVVGIGDDAAVIDFGNRPTIITVDTQVERVHFRRDLISCRDLGYRAMVAAVSDIWAMAAMPSASVVALTLDSDFPDETVSRVDRRPRRSRPQDRSPGRRWQPEPGPILVGDDDCVWLAYRQVGHPKRREAWGFRLCDGNAGLSSARPRDSSSQRSRSRPRRRASSSVGDGRPRTGTSQRQWPPSRPPRSMSRMAACKTSRTYAPPQAWARRCTPAQSRRHPATRRACKALDIDPVALALTGGEDYELMFTAPESPEAAA